MEAPWRIELLGWLRATRGEQVVTRFRSQKTGALLGYLAYHGHRSHPREALIELHWPECDLEVGRQRLRTALTSLRHQLEPPGVLPGAVILADSAAVQLNPATCGTDVAQFEARLRSAASAHSGAERVQGLTDAVALYRGELLPGYCEGWVLPERERLAEMFFQALGQLIAHAERAGDLDRALQWARRAVSADPLREAGHRDLMRLLAATGERDAALRQYRELARRLDEELGAEPEEETRALARSLPSQTGDGRRQLVPIQEPFAAPAPQSSVISLPTGTATFVLAEIAGAAALRERGEAAFAVALESCQELLRPLFRGHGGHEVDASGEVLRVAFGRASDALAAAVAGQRALAVHPGPADSAPLCVRMALHTGEIEPGEEVRGSPVLAHATRLLLAAHGGQILVSAESAALLGRDLAPGWELADLGLYRLREEAPPERLFQVRSPEMLPRAFPAPNAPPGHGGNLPLQFTRFFGRREEIAQLSELLAKGTRLVTLTGPGGSGKTRLALEAAQQWVETGTRTQRGCGAAWFVSLADLVDPRLIADAVLTVLRLPRSPGVEPLEQVIAALSRQPTLMLLDNFERLVDEGATLVRSLLERVPDLTCLVTSRQRLGLAGEREFPVLPLPVPEERDTPEQLIRRPSVQLFVDRAQAVRPDFQVTAGNAPAVAALCHRLEGIPLALVLAAARAQVLTPAQMLAHTEKRFDFLVSRQRDAASRHRTLRAAIDWSYRLLSPELQQFFARLSVFRGGWTLEAAEAVCEAPDALGNLEQLRECSLVVVEEQGSEARYRLLETLREYADEQLTPGERTDLRRRHADYCLALAEEAEQHLTRADQAAWQDRLKVEHDNLRAALDWAPASGKTEAGLRLAGALWQFWEGQGALSEGRERLVGLLSQSGTTERTAARAKALYAAGYLTFKLGDPMGARVLQEESLAIWQEMADPRGMAISLHALGHLAIDENDFRAAWALLEEALSQSRIGGDRAREGLILSSLGGLANLRGDYPLARALLKESIALQRELGNRWSLAVSLYFLGNAAFAEGDLGAAQSLWEETLAIDQEATGRGGDVLLSLGRLAAARDDYAGARAWYEEYVEQGQKTGYRLYVADGLLGLGDVACLEGDYTAARIFYQQALALQREQHNRIGIAAFLERLAGVCQAQGQPERSARLLGVAETLRERDGVPLPPMDQANYDPIVSAARVQLGEEAFLAAWAEGRALTIEQAVADVLEERT
jgi:predicted ATPase/DNA-binding SARP family transcriptional activator